MNLEELATNYYNAKEIFAKNALEVLKQEFLKVLNKWPEIKTIHWEQYTPYFNDGDTCHFRTTEIHINNNEDVPGMTDYELTSAYNEIESFFCKLPDEILMAIFGDDNKIIVTRNGIEIEDFSNCHD